MTGSARCPASKAECQGADDEAASAEDDDGISPSSATATPLSNAPAFNRHAASFDTVAMSDLVKPRSM